MPEQPPSLELPPPYKAFPSPEDGHAWGLRQTPPHQARPDYELRSLLNYKGNFHKVINAHLRGDRIGLREIAKVPALRAYRKGGMEDDIEIIKEAMAVSRIDRPVVTWRGFNSQKAAAFLLANVKKKPFVDAGFVSTTFDEAWADNLAKRGQPGPVVLTILVPEGAKAIYMEHLVGAQQGEREKELLIRHNAVFDILRAEIDLAGVARAVVELLLVGSANRSEGV